MRRAALAAACLALTASLLATSAGAGTGRPGASDAATGPGGPSFARYASETTTARCLAWKKHRKRVVKFVRRGGERRKVVRVKRWRTCKRRAAAAPAVPPVLPAPVAPEPQPEAEDPALQRLSVKAAEWSYTLSRPEVPAGEVVVELNNAGEDPHNLNLEAAGGGTDGTIPTTGPGQQGKAKFALPAGTYRLWCDLDQHAERGMEATLLVTD